VALGRDQLKVNPRDGVARAELAYYLVMLGQSREAREHLAEALDASPSDTQVLYLASQVHEILGERAEALAFLRETIRGGYPFAEVRAHPLFASLAEDPDFRELVADD
jgi:tetratricopeptide (TPR) repeat protein